MAKTITTTITETATGDANSNTSNVKVKAYFKSGSNETYFSSKTLKIYLQRIEPNGSKTQVGSWSGSVSLSQGGSVSKEVTFKNISHQTDGSLKVRAYFYIATGTSGLGTITESDTAVTKTLTTMPRASDFQEFNIKINSNSSITVNVTINKKNPNFIDELTFCNKTVTVNNGANSITFLRNTVAYTNFYKIMGNNFEETYPAALQTLDSTGTKTIGTVSILNATASLNNIDNVEGRTYGLQVTYMNVNDDNGNNYIVSTNANGTTYTSTHKVSEFTTSNTFLQNWSNPNFSYAVEAFTTLPNTATNYTFGNLISLYFNTPLPMPKIELTGAAYTGNTGGIGTNFSEAIYKIQGSDGRVNVSAPLLSIHKKAWEKPTVNLTLTRQSSTSNKVDWTLSYSYTYVARNNGNLTPTIYASYTYNGVETQLVSQNLSQTSGTLSGTITLRNADDYKYPISAIATITDMIDYKVHSKINIPSGQPAIYCHKDSNANNIVDIYGDLKTNKSLRIPRNSTAGYGLANSEGSSIIRDWNNGAVTLDAVGGDLFLGFQNTTGINILNNKVTIDSNGNLRAGAPFNGQPLNVDSFRGWAGNVNDCLTEGHYFTNSGASNLPSNNFYGYLKVMVSNGETHNNSSNWIWQEFHNTSGEVYRRNKTNGGNWSGWEKNQIPAFSEGTGVVNRTSGATLEGSSYKKWGRVVQLRINIKSGSSSTSAGSDCFVGNLNNASLYPIMNTGGMGFQASSGLIFYVNTSGEINVRVIGATFGTNKTAGGTITYLTAS